MSKSALTEKWGVKTEDTSQTSETGNTHANQNTDTRSEYFAVNSTNVRESIVKFSKRTGDSLFLHYGMLPSVRYNPDQGITFKTLQFEVLIKGRGLANLADQLGLYTVLWIKESTTGIDDENEDIFISEINFTENK